MAADRASEQSPPAGGKTRIAGFWRRLAAFLVDIIVLGVPTLLLGLAFFQWAVSLGQAGRLVGFVVALIYFSLLNSRLGGGQTLGKRLFGIRVTDRAGKALSPKHSVLRFLVFAIPYFLNGLWFDVNAASVGVIEYLLGALLIFLVFGGLGAIVYLFVFNRRTRQSLHDLAVGSFVVRGPPAAVPMVLSTPRLHLIVVGCWLTLALIAPGILFWVVRDSSLTAPLTSSGDLQAAIKEQLGVRQVKITVGRRQVATVKTGSSTTSFLRAEARPSDVNQELDSLQSEIARMVLNFYPDLLGNQVLIVSVQRGFDLGIAQSNREYRQELGPAAWRQKLAPLRTQP